MILLLNGAFGIGKTTVARAFVARSPRTVLFDPELIGIALQRIVRVGDFQDLRAWRHLTIFGLRITRWLRPNVIVPMAISNPAYLREIVDGLRRFEPRVFHFCLTAPVDVVRERLRRRPPNAWVERRAAECCVAHGDDTFATHIDASSRTPDELAEELLRAVTARGRA